MTSTVVQVSDLVSSKKIGAKKDVDLPCKVLLSYAKSKETHCLLNSRGQIVVSEQVVLIFSVDIVDQLQQV